MMTETQRVMLETIVRVAEQKGITISGAQLTEIANFVVKMDTMPMAQKIKVLIKLKERFEKNPELYKAAQDFVGEHLPDALPRLKDSIRRENPFAPG